MTPLTQRATKVFKQLVADLKQPGDSKKIDNTNGVFMAVHVDFIAVNEHGRHYAVAHYYEQYGDLMADPEMTFLYSAVDGQVYPLTFRQDSFPAVNQVAATAEAGESIKCSLKVQQDIARFANLWLKNINAQQGLKGG